MLAGHGGLHLGVDLGTSHSVGVLAWPGGRTQALLFDASPLLPSAVYADLDGRILVGRDAVRSARSHPDRFEPYPKRRVDEGTVLLGTAEYPTPQLLAAVLGHVAAEAVRVGGQPPTRVVLTHPGGWGGHRRRILLDAAQRCGLGQVTLLPEPVAAAVYFNQVLGHQVPDGDAVVVYDFGGGTFDVSVVRRLPHGWDVVASDGLEGVGGVDLDAVLVETLGEVIAARDPEVWRRLTTPSGIADRRHRQMLYTDARAAKEQLSRQSSAAVHVPMLDEDVPVTREQFEQVARPLLERTVALTAETLVRTGVARTDIAGLFLVGGSSRIPLVATMLHQRLGVPPTVLEQPELVVAQGALQATAAPPAGVAGPPASPPHGVPGLDGFPPAAPPGPAPGAPVSPPATVPWTAEPAAPAGAVSRTRPASPGSTWWPHDTPWWRRRLTVVGWAVLILVVAVQLGNVLLPDGNGGLAPDGNGGQQELTARGRDNAAAFTSAELKAFARPWLNDMRFCGTDEDGNHGAMSVVGVTTKEVVTCGVTDEWIVQFVSYVGDGGSQEQRDFLRGSSGDDADLQETDISGGVRIDLTLPNGHLVYWDREDEEVGGILVTNGDTDLGRIWEKYAG